MKITVCKPSELGSTEIAHWRAWQQADPELAKPFLAPEFAVVLSRHHAAARVAVLSEGNETVGFLPFERHPGRVGRALAYGLGDFQALIGRPGLTWQPAELLAGCDLAVFEFDHLVASQAAQWAPRELSYHESPVIDLTGDWDEWLARKRKQSPSRMKKALQYERRLGRELGELRFDLDSESTEDLSLLMQWKGAQYVRTGRANRFAKPWFRDFVTELFSLREPHFRLGLSRLQAGGRTAALLLFLRDERIVTGWFPAYDVEVATYSPGMICWLGLLRAGREHGIERVELGRGDHDYKQVLADSVEQVAEGVAERPGGAAVLRRVVTAPRRVATDIVLGNPRLRSAARETLNQMGRLRAKLS